MEEGVSPTFATGPARNQPNSVWKGATGIHFLSGVEIDSNRSRSPPEQPSVTLVSTKFNTLQSLSAQADAKADRMYNPAHQAPGLFPGRAGVDSNSFRMRPMVEEGVDCGSRLDPKADIYNLPSIEHTLQNRSSSGIVGGMPVSSRVATKEAMANLIPESRQLVPRFRNKYKRAGILQLDHQTKGTSLCFAKSSTVGADNSRIVTNPLIEIKGSELQILTKKVGLNSDALEKINQQATKYISLGERKNPILNQVALYLNGARIIEERPKYLQSRSLNRKSITTGPTIHQPRKSARYLIPDEGIKRRIPPSIVNTTIFIRSRSQPNLSSKCRFQKRPGSGQLDSSPGDTDSNMSALQSCKVATRRVHKLSTRQVDREEGILEKNFVPKSLTRTGTSNDTDGLFLVKNYNRYDSQRKKISLQKSHNEISVSKLQPKPKEFRPIFGDSARFLKDHPNQYSMLMPPSQRSMIAHFQPSDQSVAHRTNLSNEGDFGNVPNFNFDNPGSRINQASPKLSTISNQDDSKARTRSPAGVATPPMTVDSRTIRPIDTNLDLEAIIGNCSVLNRKRIELGGC